jgi:hypothetical protein
VNNDVNLTKLLALTSNSTSEQVEKQVVRGTRGTLGATGLNHETLKSK